MDGSHGSGLTMIVLWDEEWREWTGKWRGGRVDKTRD